MKGNICNFATTIVIGLSIVASMYLYTTTFDKKIEARKLENTERITNIKDCLAKQDTKYSADWDSKCEVVGKKAACTLTALEYSSVDETYKDNRAMCLSIYNYGGLSF